MGGYHIRDAALFRNQREHLPPGDECIWSAKLPTEENNVISNKVIHLYSYVSSNMDLSEKSQSKATEILKKTLVV